MGLSRTLIGAMLCMAGFALCPTAPAADRVLTTSEELGDPAVATGIEDFWDQHKADVSFKGQGGLKIFAVHFRQPDPGTERGAITIVSGRTEATVKYKETVYDLWRNGYSVYLYDHRGQGQSDREPDTADEPQKGHVGRFDDYVADLQLFIKGQILPMGHRRHYLLAHSMGGAITARYLESNVPELKRINAAVLSSPMLQIEGLAFGLPADVASCRLADFFVKAGKASEYSVGGGGYKPKDFSANEYTTSEVRYRRLIEQYSKTPQVRLGSPTWGWVHRACEGARLAREKAASVQTPVLVMVAGKDKIVHNEGAKEFCKNLAGAGRRCEPADDQTPLTVPGSRHEMFIEADQQRNKALQTAIGFFAKH